MIVRWTDGGWKEKEWLLDALNLSKDDEPRVVSLVGAGEDYGGPKAQGGVSGGRDISCGDYDDAYAA